MLKQVKMLKTAVCAMLFAAACSMTAAAAPQDAGASGKGLPFAFEVTDADYQRLCYAGHDGSGVKYREGFAIPDDATFEIVNRGTDAAANAANLKVEVVLLYENSDNTKGMRETVRTFEKGDLKDDGTSYSLLSENNIENLSERDMLYSDSTQSLQVKVTYDSGRGTKSEQFYFQVSSPEMMDAYANGAE